MVGPYRPGTKKFAHPSPNFYVVKSAKFGLDFRRQSPLKRSDFEMEQIIVSLKLKQALRAQMIGLDIDSYISPILPCNI